MSEVRYVWGSEVRYMHLSSNNCNLSAIVATTLRIHYAINHVLRMMLLLLQLFTSRSQFARSSSVAEIWMLFQTCTRLCKLFRVGSGHIVGIVGIKKETGNYFASNDPHRLGLELLGICGVNRICCLYLFEIAV